MSKKLNKRIALKKINPQSFTKDSTTQDATSVPSLLPQVLSTPSDDIAYDAKFVPEVTLNRLWGIFNRCLSSNQPDLQYLTGISNVMYKTIASYQRIENVEIKKQELCMKQELHKTEMEKIELAKKPHLPRERRGLTEEELHFIERELNFL